MIIIPIGAGLLCSTKLWEEGQMAGQGFADNLYVSHWNNHHIYNCAGRD